MGLLSRLFGSSDPTHDWPPPGAVPPELSLERRGLATTGGTLTFGDPFDRARLIGRPDRYRKHGERNRSIAYDAWNLELQFEDDRFVEACFTFPAAEGDGPSPAAARRGPDGLGLSAATSPADVVGRIGEPARRRAWDAGETTLVYTRGTLTSEFEFDEDGRLTAWTVTAD